MIPVEKIIKMHLPTPDIYKVLLFMFTTKSQIFFGKKLQNLRGRIKVSAQVQTCDLQVSDFTGT
jgi:hypothetical protein